MILVRKIHNMSFVTGISAFAASPRRVAGRTNATKTKFRTLAARPNRKATENP